MTIQYYIAAANENEYILQEWSYDGKPEECVVNDIESICFIVNTNEDPDVIKNCLISEARDRFDLELTLNDLDGDFIDYLSS